MSTIITFNVKYEFEINGDFTVEQAIELGKQACQDVMNRKFPNVDGVSYLDKYCDGMSVNIEQEGVLFF